MAKIAIRPARVGDLDALVDLLGLLFSIEADFDFDASRQRQGFLMMFDHDGAIVLVAEAEGEVVGMCSGQLTISTAEGGAALLVEDVVVARSWQGQGIGRTLMVALEQWAGNRKARRLQLLADRTNQSGLQFYKTMGWQATELICLRKRLPSSSFNEVGHVEK